MYTKGIRKIYCPFWKVGTELSKAQKQAEISGYNLLAYNSIIWAKNPYKDEWIRTNLELEDFEA